MDEDIDNYIHYPLKTHQYKLFPLDGKDLRRDGLSLIVAEYTRIPWV